jgi:hypothetical protein
VDDVSQIALDVVVLLAPVSGEDLQRRARRGQRGLGADELGVHQFGVAGAAPVEQVNGVIGGEPRGHQA